MTGGDIHSVRVPITLDYLAAADTAVTFVDITGGLCTNIFAILTSTIVDVSGKNSKRKTVVTISSRETE